MADADADALHRDHIAVTVVEPTGRKAQLVYAANEFETVVPFAFSKLRMLLFVALSICSGGFLLVVCAWFPHFFTYIARLRLPAACLGDAHYLLVLVRGKAGSFASEWSEVKVHRIDTSTSDASSKAKRFSFKRANPDPDDRQPVTVTRCSSFFTLCWSCCRKSSAANTSTQSRPFVWFEFRKQRYSFDYATGEYKRFRAAISEEATAINRRNEDGGLAEVEAIELTKLVGSNRVEIAKPNVAMLLFTKAVHPYYLFQVFSSIVWFFEDYVIYAAVILALSAVSLTWEIGTELVNNAELRTLVPSDGRVRVLRRQFNVDTSDEADGAPVKPKTANVEPVEVDASALVPGDILIVQNGRVCADLLLLSGSCTADELSLTGEARPLAKQPLPATNNNITDVEARKTYPTAMLHAGTQLSDVALDSRAVVLSTGFSTGKGKLLRSILFPKQITFEFERDSYRYLLVLAAVAIAAFIKRVVDNSAAHGHSFLDTLIESLDLITIAVPPALPLVLSSGIGFALRRLRRRGIFCIDAQRINSCGQISCFCFDKTGTLTKEDLKLVGVALSVDADVPDNVLSPDSLSDTMRWGMACCHGLTSMPNVEETEKSSRRVMSKILKRVNRSGKSGDQAADNIQEPAKSSFWKCAKRKAKTIAEGEDENRLGASLDMALFQASGYTFYRGNGGDLGVWTNREEAISDPTELKVVVDAKAAGTRPPNTEAFIFVKRHPFDSELQRSSVVVERDVSSASNPSSRTRSVWVKGSPERVGDLCSDAPADLKTQTTRFAAEGYYCVVLAMKELGVDDDVEDRVEMERDLAFQGLLLFKNEVKPEAAPMLQELYAADIDVRVITGDNALTAVHVCGELKMKLKARVAVVDIDAASDDAVYQVVNVDPRGGAIILSRPNEKSVQEDENTRFDGSNMSRVISEHDIAITGRALEKLRIECNTDSMNQLLSRTRIFARVNPKQKAWIVEQLMELGHIVGMCGDGTNDCGALKAAHVGLALSSAEASIVAPFTSKGKRISDVPVLIREGRCALTTSFLAFKYMVLYPIIQLAMASTLAHYDLILTNNQYIWDDMAIVLGLAILMLYTEASKTLTKERPPKTLFSLIVSGSILGQVAIFIVFFAGQVNFMHNQPSWFCSIKDAYAYLGGDSTVSSNCAVYIEYNSPDNEYSYEVTCIWLFSHLQYISVAAAFNLNDPFRRPFYFNWRYTIFFLGTLGVNLWFLLDTSGSIDGTFQTMPIPFDYRWRMLLLFIGHFGAAVVWELLVTRFVPWVVNKCVKREGVRPRCCCKVSSFKRSQT